MKQTLTHQRGKIDFPTIIVRNLNTPPSEMDRSRGQKISKDVVGLNNTTNQLGTMQIYIPSIQSIYIYRLLHPATAEYTFFLSSHKTFTKIGYILGHETHLNTFKIVQIIQCLLSDHKGIRLEMNTKMMSGNSQILSD